MATDVDHDAVSFVSRGRVREAIVATLAGEELTPTEIARQADLNRSYVYRVCEDLREAGIAELLVDEETHRGRFHALTDKGEAVAARLDERDGGSDGDGE